jgi:hypothetical protein
VVLSLERVPSDEFTGNRRRFRISTNVAAKLQTRADDLVELVSQSSGSSLRGWLAIEAGEKTDLALGPLGMRILGASAGDRVEIRLLRSPSI